MRIVSLLPSATEILHAVGAGEQVVGLTFECDSPPHAREAARIVSTSALPEGLTPAEIDAAVRRLIGAGEDIYRLDRSALRGLAADLVVTQDLCAVCAVDVEEVHDALDFLGCTADVLTADPHRLDEVWESVTTIAAAAGRRSEGERLTAALRTRTAAVAESVAGRRRPGCMVLEWTEPPYAPGHWVPEMVSVAGGRSVLGEAGARSRPTSWRSVAAAEPEAIIVAPCGFDLPRASALTDELLSGDDLPPDVPVWAVDANASFARPGPRLADGIEALARILHPDLGEPDPLIAKRIR